MIVSREQLRRIRGRHLGYRITLVYELSMVLLLPVAQLFPPLISVLLIGQATLFMIFARRFSLLRTTRLPIYVLGCLAIALEVVWHAAMVVSPAVARHLTLPQVVVWVLFLLLVVVRKVQSLIREPFVTVSVVLGAAAGYLTVGIAGGVILSALWVVQPTAFVAANLPQLAAASPGTVALTPALWAASFGLLTTVGTSVLTPGNINAQVIANVITISGQLYVAILIALILGRAQKRLS